MGDGRIGGPKRVVCLRGVHDLDSGEIQMEGRHPPSVMHYDVSNADNGVLHGTIRLGLGTHGTA